MLSTASATLRKRAIESSFKARNSVKIRYWSPNRVKFLARTPTVLGARRCCGGRPRSISLSARNACSGPPSEFSLDKANMASTNCSGLFKWPSRLAHSSSVLKCLLRRRISRHTSRFPGTCGCSLGSNWSRVTKSNRPGSGRNTGFAGPGEMFLPRNAS